MATRPNTKEIGGPLILLQVFINDLPFQLGYENPRDLKELIIQLFYLVVGVGDSTTYVPFQLCPRRLGIFH